MSINVSPRATSDNSHPIQSGSSSLARKSLLILVITYSHSMKHDFCTYSFYASFYILAELSCSNMFKNVLKPEKGGVCMKEVLMSQWRKYFSFCPSLIRLNCVESGWMGLRARQRRARCICPGGGSVFTVGHRVLEIFFKLVFFSSWGFGERFFWLVSWCHPRCKPAGRGAAKVFSG